MFLIFFRRTAVLYGVLMGSAVSPSAFAQQELPPVAPFQNFGQCVAFLVVSGFPQGASEQACSALYEQRPPSFVPYLPTHFEGIWDWKAYCRSGEYIGVLSLKDGHNGGNLSGTFSTVGGGGVMQQAWMNANGEIQFLRNLGKVIDNNDLIQTWYGRAEETSPTDSRVMFIVGDITQTHGQEECYFELRRRR